MVVNRTLKRPMFRIGGSAGTGITSGLDRPQKMANGGRTGYQEGTTPNFQTTGLPGFLTSFGLNLLSTPAQGNIFQTAERIAGMKTTDTTERIQAIADTKYDGDTIKASREVDFATETYPNLIAEYGQESVATSVIDSSGFQKPKDIQRFVKQNPQLARQVIYDVRTGKAMRFVKDQTGKFALVPADSADIDTTGEGMPAPESQTPRSFDFLSPGQKKVIEDIQAGADKEFGIGFYD
jgi:hypothetical protein